MVSMLGARARRGPLLSAQRRAWTACEISSRHLMSGSVPAVVKWGKERFNVLLHPGSPVDELKQELYRLTMVPVERQKAMCPRAWKGALKDGTTLSEALALKPGESELTIMLMGSAEAAPVAPAEPTVFQEDISPEAAAAAEAAATAEAVAAAEGMIPALQLPPGAERAESKALMSNLPIKYNHFVSGLAQDSIEQTLRTQRADGGRLLDVCAMTLGHELGKAYVNAVACLGDGTCVSGCDNGRMQLWKHGRRVVEIMHEGPLGALLGGTPEAVACLAALPDAPHGVAFASGGDGSVKMWTADGELVATFMAPAGTAPRRLVALGHGDGGGGHGGRGGGAGAGAGLGVVFHQARPFDASAFRLPPQTDEQRRRRAEAMAAQAAQAAEFERIARSVTVIDLVRPPETDISDGGATAAGGGAPVPRATVLPGDVAAAPVMALAELRGTGTVQMASGDTRGGLRVFRRGGGGAGALAGGDGWVQSGHLHLASAGCSVAVVLLEPLSSQRRQQQQPTLLAAALSMATAAGGGADADGATTAEAAAPPGAAVLDVPRTAHGAPVLVLDALRGHALALLDAHTDLVRCMCAMPDGALLTGGGKHDGTVKVWANALWQNAPRPSSAAEDEHGDEGAAVSSGGSAGAQVSEVREATQTLSAPGGYVFGMAILPDAKPGSTQFALACARYNTVRILL